MRKILIPTDFSENAMNAIRYALELFKYEESEFFIIHAFADEVYDQSTSLTRELFDEVKKIMQEKSNEGLQKIFENVKAISPNPRHTYKMISVFGTLIDKANDFVDEENIDIVVMGTKGKTDDRKLTFGSNTLQVLKYVKCPVLAIPEGCFYSSPKNILFPTDYMLPYKRRELKLIRTMSKSFRSTINFLYITTFKKLSIRQEDNKAFLKDCLPDIELSFHVKEADNITTAINSFLVKNRIDLLVMINSRHTYLENILYQSTIDRIGLYIKIPFLTIQNLQR
ncbi:universal stress protein [Aquimarina sp. AU474]|uniref:universal stress protein n=1 Tax=Aquimarina sp. AU474 TaxID=2108529 RepID=UPI000D68A076|nr:universal stress protein [Aquimarina sp. AU474]